MKKRLVITCISILMLFAAVSSGAAMSISELCKSDICYAQSNYLTLPVIMYHQILNSVRGTYIVTEAQLQNDLNAFKANGYTTVFPSEVIAYVSDGKPLPPKPILITFDDGYYNNYYYGKNVMQKNNAKALISVVGMFTERTVTSNEKLNPHYSHLTWKNMQELASSGNFEIGNHTYDMHYKSPRFGIGQMRGEDTASYKNAITADTLKLKNKLVSLGIKSEVFAYPFGKYNTTAHDTLSELGYKMLLTCNEGINIIASGKPQSIQSLFRINRDGGYSTAELMRQIDHPYKINNRDLA